MRVEELVISESIAEKLAVKHGVTLEEVEEACLYRPAHEQVWRREKGGTMRCSPRPSGAATSSWCCPIRATGSGAW